MANNEKSLRTLGSLIGTIEGLVSDSEIDSGLKGTLEGIKSSLKAAQDRYQADIRSQTQVESRLREADDWSEKVTTKFHPEPGIFNKSAHQIATYFNDNSDSFAQAMERLSFYDNRGGDNLSTLEKTKLKQAKDILRKLNGKNESRLSEGRPTDASIKFPIGSRVHTTMGVREAGTVIVPLSSSDKYTDGSYRGPENGRERRSAVYVKWDNGTQGWINSIHLGKGDGSYNKNGVWESRLSEKHWSKSVKPKFHPEPGIFEKPAEEIAHYFKDESDSEKQAMSRINFYKNRAGKNLSSEEQGKLNHAKELLKNESFGDDVDLLSDKPETVADKLRRTCDTVQAAINKVDQYVNQHTRELWDTDVLQLDAVKELVRQRFGVFESAKKSKTGKFGKKLDVPDTDRGIEEATTPANGSPMIYEKYENYMTVYAPDGGDYPPIYASVDSVDGEKFCTLCVWYNEIKDWLDLLDRVSASEGRGALYTNGRSVGAIAEPGIWSIDGKSYRRSDIEAAVKQLEKAVVLQKNSTELQAAFERQGTIIAGETDEFDGVTAVPVDGGYEIPTDSSAFAKKTKKIELPNGWSFN